jgi:hypothetical protein
VQPRQGGLEVTDEVLDEPRAIPALQGELFVVNDDGVHELDDFVIWLSGH